MGGGGGGSQPTCRQPLRFSLLPPPPTLPQPPNLLFDACCVHFTMHHSLSCALWSLGYLIGYTGGGGGRFVSSKVCSPDGAEKNHSHHTCSKICLQVEKNSCLVLEMKKQIVEKEKTYLPTGVSNGPPVHNLV